MGFWRYVNTGGGTLIPNGVKVADKGKMWKIMKFDKFGLKLLLDIGLEELCPNMVQSLFKNWWNDQYVLLLFFIFIKIENSLSKNLWLANKK